MQVILFDSDGVLVDTEQIFFEATRSAFKSAGVDLSASHWARLYLGEGKRSHEIAHLYGIPPAQIQTVIANRNALFWQRIDAGVPVLPGVRAALQQLARRFRLAVVTGASRSHFDRVHSSTRLTGLFKAIITSDDYEHAKPHPQSYLTAMDRLTATPEECLAVEDSPRGARAALAAGLSCVIIPTLLTDMTLCPDNCMILPDMMSLVQTINNIKKNFCV